MKKIAVVIGVAALWGIVAIMFMQGQKAALEPLDAGAKKVDAQIDVVQKDTQASDSPAPSPPLSPSTPLERKSP